VLIEALGTAILHFFIFAVVDRRNRDAPGGNLAPFFIGFSVAIIISVLVPLTQAGLSPARDFGPRLFACLAGWGSIAIPGPNGICWAYVVAPFWADPWGRRCTTRMCAPYRRGRSNLCSTTMLKAHR
jgi:glycerol uptake facilitator protein